jgi:hypothetical protein
VSFQAVYNASKVGADDKDDPDGVKAELHRKMAEPGSAEKG